MENPEVCKVIQGAINILETEGWGTETYYNPDTNAYCAVGALYQASGYRVGQKDADFNFEFKPLVSHVLKVVASALPKSAQGKESTPWFNITDYNDSLKTKAPIIKLFKRALEIC